MSESKKEKEVVSQIGEDSGAIVEKPSEEQKREGMVKEELQPSMSVMTVIPQNFPCFF